MRALVQASYFLRRRVLALLRFRTHGVKVMLFNEAGELLLVRNAYGNRNQFLLPGGGVGRREAPKAAAAREVREELGVEARRLTLIAAYESAAEGKRDNIHLFRAVASETLSTDPIEIDEANFFRSDDLPSNTSPATLRRVEELRGERPIDGRW